MKKCTKCGVEKHESDFSKTKSTKDGYNIWCKKCFFEYRNNPENKEKKRLYEIEYRKTDLYKQKKKIERNTIKNKEYMKEYNKSYRLKPNNIAKEKERKNSIEYKLFVSEYRKSNKYKSYRKEYRKLYFTIIREKNYRLEYCKSDNYKKRYIKRNFEKWNGFPPPPELVEVKLLINKTKRLCKTLKN